MPKPLLFQEPTALDLDTELGETSTKAGLFQIGEVLNESPKVLCVQDNAAANLVRTVLVVVSTLIQKKQVAHHGSVYSDLAAPLTLM
jgi:hypothetical protein